MADDEKDNEAPAEATPAAATPPAPKKKAAGKRKRSGKKSKTPSAEAASVGTATPPLKPVERTLGHPDNDV